MTNYRYLGYGVTDSNGIAHLDHDANGDALTHSYTGVGAGEIDVLASLDNPISQGSIVSETYSVIDAILYDTNTNHYSKWGNRSNRLTITADTTGTLLENSSGNSGYYGLGEPTRASTENYMFDWEIPICFEFDILNYSQANQVYVQISDQNKHDYIKDLSQLSATTSSHIKIEIKDKIYVTVDNTALTPVDNTFVGKFLFCFALKSGYSFKFENFRAYLI